MEETDYHSGSGVLSLPNKFSELIIRGNELDEKHRKYLFGFDFEIQLGNLDYREIAFINKAVDRVCMLIHTLEETDNDITKSWLKKEIAAINIEVKEVVRCTRGKDGFTVKELGTQRQKAWQELKQEREKRAGFFQRRKKEQ